jgi:hypothetical protein
MQTGFFIIIILLGIILRILPRLLRACVVDSDTAYHLLVAERIRSSRFRLPQFIQGFILQTPYTYPPLYHYLLALMPKRLREGVEPYMGALIDTFHAVSIFLFCIGSGLFASLSSAWQVQLVSLLAMLIFLTYPALLSATPLRVYQGTPRPLGEWLFSIVMFSLGFYTMQGNWVWFAFSVLTAALLLLCSKFGAQVFLFSSIFIAAWMGKPDLLLLLPLAIATAILISKGHYLNVLSGQIQHSLFYQRYIIKSHPVKERNTLSDLVHLPKDLFLNPGRAFQTLYEKNTFSALIIRNPYLVLVGYFLLLSSEGLLSEYRFLFGWIMSCVFAFAVTSLRPFLFLGEAERYVEYAVPAVSVLTPAILVRYGNATGWLIWLVIIVYSLVFVAGNHFIVVRRCSKQKRQELEALKKWLSQTQETPKILPIPAHFLGRFLVKETCHQVLFFSDNLNEKFLSGEEFLKIFPEYPFPSDDFEYLASQYQIDLIVCEKGSISQAEKRGLNYDFSNWSLIFENSEYRIYRKNGVPGQSVY